MIAFLQPFALLGLVVAAIPALLHLLGRRLPPTVVFPAVRYLTATEREHSQRLRFRNLLLLLLRTAVLVFLVMAAARPMLRTGAGDTHEPTALALVVDNSGSSGAFVEGKRALDTIVAVARGVIDRVGAEDHLWLVLADGIPVRLTRLEAKGALNELNPSWRRLDLGGAVRAAAEAIANDPLPNGPVVVVSDLQASALSSGSAAATRVIAWQPMPLNPNRWLDSVRSQPEIWSPSGGVAVSVGGTPGRPVTLRLRIPDRELDRTLASPGDRTVLSGTLPKSGWAEAAVELDPDELRADDRRVLALFRAEPATVSVASEIGSFMEAALSVLRESGRASSGSGVALGSMSSTGVSIIFPPSDPAMVGALNRTLASRAVDWQFEEMVEGEWELSDASGTAEGAAVYRRYRLSGDGDVFATVTGEPWLVRSGDAVLVASRMVPEWTRLPISAAFVPFVDFLLNRIAAEETWIVRGNPGDAVELPVSARTVFASGVSTATTVPEDGRISAPLEPGVYYMSGALGDTVGALEINLDRRESLLRVADESQLRATFGERSRILNTVGLYGELFGASGSYSLAGLFLIAALLALLGEFVLASYHGRTGKLV